MVDTLVTGKMLKREPRVTLDAVRMGRKKMFVTSAKAERELGWNPRPVDDALRRAVEWFRANGYVRKPVAIVAAMRREVAPLLRGVRAAAGGRRRAIRAGTAVVAVGGIGRDAAGVRRKLGCAATQPKRAGFGRNCGRAVAELKVGDVVACREVIDALPVSASHRRWRRRCLRQSQSVSGPRGEANRWRSTGSRRSRYGRRRRGAGCERARNRSSLR